ncbi:hypothetical protein BUALT_Bualt06G0110300 [Buddleja alternifolia]|uniref:Uncharacterized protein n=1 Tax=Buddleja alternifolia TaxID=168488 RepID=A0AAV6XEF8_9LAMI|nr:hypothetical protein BUALT_Bualt06G0110300 [Buddleja alternifolia]
MLSGLISGIATQALVFLQAQGNQLDSSLLELKYLSYLDLSYNNFKRSPIPAFLGSMKQLQYLNLSAGNFNGIVPHDLWSNLINHLPRNIGHMMPLLELFTLSQNSINGSIPDSLCEMKALRNLDLSNNYFSGTIPDCWENSQDLLVMRLSSNELSGIIPNSIGGAYSLQWLRLNNNSLIGQLPSSLKNCTNLELTDVGENKLSGTLLEWIGNDLLDLNILRLIKEQRILWRDSLHILPNYDQRANVFRSFDDLQWLEQSMGQVIKGVEVDKPFCLDWSQFVTQSFLGGKIPAKIGDLKSLISLDLSNNNLFGTIPDSLSNLNFLSHLNVSHNNLPGPIPTGNQIQTLEDPSIYDGNPELCGAPLHKKCHNDEAPNGETHVAADEDDQAEKLYLYGVIISGFATGFGGLLEFWHLKGTGDKLISLL